MNKKQYFAETICYEVVEVYTNDINDVYLVLFYDYSLKNAIKFLETQKRFILTNIMKLLL